MKKIYVEINGPRPPYYNLPNELWPGVGFDSDGNSHDPESKEWTELSITNRENESLRINIDPVNENPLVFVVESDTPELTIFAANWLVSHAAGKILYNYTE